MNITVLGAGSWGTALAILLARNGHNVTLFGKDEEDLQATLSVRENLRYLPGFVIPREVNITWDPEQLSESDLWVVAIPSTGFRSFLHYIKGDQPLVVIASKGLELTTHRLLSDVVAEEIPAAQVAALSGPNLAVEIVRGIPTAAVAASADLLTAERVANTFNCRTYRVYLTDDLIGVELAGALKNVLAIAAGISDGLGFGDNTKGALLARGLNEMAQLGLALGGKMETFLGLAGVGDLFATANSQLSRNYRLGKMIGEGAHLREAINTLGQVAEGVNTAEVAMVLARRSGVIMPVFEMADNVLRARLTAFEAVERLMEHNPKRESVI